MEWTKEEKEEVYKKEEMRKRQITEQDLYDMEVAEEMD